MTERTWRRFYLFGIVPTPGVFADSSRRDLRWWVRYLGWFKEV